MIFNYPSPGQFFGHVRFEAATATWVLFGTLSERSLTLAPRASESFSLSVATPAQPGDQSGSIVLTSHAAQPTFASTTTVPVTLRALIATPTPTTTFTGGLTGATGRQFDLGQTAYYEVSVPPGLPELNASIATANPQNTFTRTPVLPTTSLPDASSTKLVAGIPATFDVKVTNTGTSREAYFVDGRLSQTAQIQLAALNASQVSVPIGASPPLYVVPTHTSRITGIATAVAPLYFDYWWAFGDPDLISEAQPPSDSASGTSQPIRSWRASGASHRIPTVRRAPTAYHHSPPLRALPLSRPRSTQI